jgi:C1A family cysteine protease
MVARLDLKMSRRFGWVPDVPDHRDYLLAAPMERGRSLPAMVDLRPRCPGVYDQLSLGSCTANAIAGVFEFDQMRQAAADIFTPSRLFIYYNERAREHTVGTDSGASLRDGIKSVAKQGACAEVLWPYVDDGRQFAEKPAASCYGEAVRHRAVSYARLPRALVQMKACLAAGYPFVFGFSVYESFMSDEVASTGRVPMPTVAEAMVGGHAVAAVGYDDAAEIFITRNSWGEQWGLSGYCLMPYKYLLNENLADDFWVVRSVEG